MKTNIKKNANNFCKFWQFFAILTIFYNFDSCWQFLQKKFTNFFLQVLQFFFTIFTIFYNFDNFWHLWQFLTFWQFVTIFDNVDGFDNFYVYGQFLTLLTILDNFTISICFKFVDSFDHSYVQSWIIVTMTMIIQETCGLCDIDYNSDNWETEFMTIFVTWQLRVTLDSIYSCNFCEVYPAYKSSKLCKFCHSPNLGMLLVTSNWYIISEYNEYGLKGGQNLEFIWLKNVLQRW